jgi:phosphoadenosine phosphosulfate reductase
VAVAGVAGRNITHHRRVPRPLPSPVPTHANNRTGDTAVGLIPSPRHTTADLETWARYEHYDTALAESAYLGTLADRARALIEEFASVGECYCSVSWGKDSVVVAHLVATSSVAGRVPLVFARARDWETPEVDQVRDAFLAAHPHVSYEEKEFTFRVPMRGEPGFEDDAARQDALGETLANTHGGRHISGVRAEESRIRAMSLRWHGEATVRSCRPIIKWRCADHVFPYLDRHDLPIHPAYGMSVGGFHDRRWLRVHALGCEHPGLSAARGDDPWAWEDRYYGDVLDAARSAREGMWARTSPP